MVENHMKIVFGIIKNNNLQKYSNKMVYKNCTFEKIIFSIGLQYT